MSMKNIHLRNISTGRKRIFVCPKSRAREIGALLVSKLHGKLADTYLNWPTSWKMDEWLVLPEIGTAVSRGALATKEASWPKGAGFVCARKGAIFPVGVGPATL